MFTATLDFSEIKGYYFTLIIQDNVKEIKIQFELSFDEFCIIYQKKICCRKWYLYNNCPELNLKTPDCEQVDLDTVLYENKEHKIELTSTSVIFSKFLTIKISTIIFYKSIDAIIDELKKRKVQPNNPELLV